jgi:hypothetical protein
MLTLAQIFAAHTGPLPAVALRDGTHRRGIILGLDDSGNIELGTDGIALPVDPDLPAQLVTDANPGVAAHRSVRQQPTHLPVAYP